MGEGTLCGRMPGAMSQLQAGRVGRTKIRHVGLCLNWSQVHAVARDQVSDWTPVASYAALHRHIQILTQLGIIFTRGEGTRTPCGSKPGATNQNSERRPLNLQLC